MGRRGWGNPAPAQARFDLATCVLDTQFIGMCAIENVYDEHKYGHSESDGMDA